MKVRNRFLTSRKWVCLNRPPKLRCALWADFSCISVFKIYWETLVAKAWLVSLDGTWTCLYTKNYSMWNSVEQEVLEREIGRLRALYQQQQQPQTQPQQQPSGSHRRSNSRDLESQFANLSLKHKDTNSGQDPALRI